MARSPELTERIRIGLAQLIEHTSSGQIKWERQANSAHRFTKWKNRLLIIGPNDQPDDSDTPRYLFVTSFDSPDHIEINSSDTELGSLVLALVDTVNASTAKTPATDPFSVTEGFLASLFD